MDLSTFHIETQRLLLLPAIAEFSHEVFKAYRPPVTDFMYYPAPDSEAGLHQRMKAREKDMQKDQLLYLAILDKHSREFLGSMGIDNLASNQPELGGWLKQEVQGKGYGKEAFKALLTWAEENLRYAYFLWPCAKENIASCRLAEYLGGKLKRSYLKTNYEGITREFLDYHIPPAKSSE